MNKYVGQLVQDIRQAARSDNEVTRATRHTGISFEEEMEAIETWIEDALPQEPIKAILGLEPIQFPPAARLNWRQMKVICEAFEGTLLTYNIAFDMPARLPYKTRYELLIGKLNEPVTVTDDGVIAIEFCEYSPETCPFGQRYCTCKKWVKELPEYDLDISEQGAALIEHIRSVTQSPPGKCSFHPLYEEDDTEMVLLSQPVCHWLGIELERFPTKEDILHDDAVGITDVIIDLFPDLGWSWIVDASITERYQTCLQLLRVKAICDYTGSFHTTKKEMTFFDDIATHYMDERYRRKREDNNFFYPFFPDDWNDEEDTAGQQDDNDNDMSF